MNVLLNLDAFVSDAICHAKDIDCLTTVLACANSVVRQPKSTSSHDLWYAHHKISLSYDYLKINLDLMTLYHYYFHHIL